MSKAILVLNDMPHSCYECPLHKKDSLNPLGHFTYEQLYVCSVMPEERWDSYDENAEDVEVYINGHMVEHTKPDWCPLQQMPEKSRTGKSGYYQWGDWEDGWNACIDGLLP